MNETVQKLSLLEYEFERSFDERAAFDWFQEHWTKSFIFSSVYVVVVFGGRHFMRQRERLELRKPLALWSFSLAIFSIMGTLRTGLYMLHVISEGGFKQSVCDSMFYSAPVSKFWAYAFTLSKGPELVDTVFIVLRKQRLIFLHWYHHITVLLYSWYSYKDQMSGGAWFMTMNFAVHSVMYSYYAARAASVPVPRALAMLITTMQILQMAMGLAVLGFVSVWMHPLHCPSTPGNLTWGSLMYLSYLLLFASFFYQSYLKRPEEKGTKAE